MSDDLTQLRKDVAAIRDAVLGSKLNGTVTSKGILARLDRLEKAVVGLALLLLATLGITGGSSIADWIRGL